MPSEADTHSWFQRMLKATLSGARFDRIRRETKEWQVSCGECGRSQDLWSAGGMRTWGLGRAPQRGFCANCGTTRPIILSKRS